ncbi:hypothetical protein RCL1_007776 [Eukaryota sp. TZLM3-RCL]
MTRYEADSLALNSNEIPAESLQFYEQLRFVLKRDIKDLQRLTFKSIVTESSEHLSNALIAQTFCSLVNKVAASCTDLREFCGQLDLIPTILNLITQHSKDTELQRSVAACLLTVTHSNLFHSIEAISHSALPLLAKSFVNHSSLSEVENDSIQYHSVFACFTTLIHSTTTKHFCPVNIDLFNVLDSPIDLYTFLTQWVLEKIPDPFLKIPRDFTLSVVFPALESLDNLLNSFKFSIDSMEKEIEKVENKISDFSIKQSNLIDCEESLSSTFDLTVLEMNNFHARKTKELSLVDESIKKQEELIQKAIERLNYLKTKRNEILNVDYLTVLEEKKNEIFKQKGRISEELKFLSKNLNDLKETRDTFSQQLESSVVSRNSGLSVQSNLIDRASFCLFGTSEFASRDSFFSLQNFMSKLSNLIEKSRNPINFFGFPHLRTINMTFSEEINEQKSKRHHSTIELTLSNINDLLTVLSHLEADVIDPYQSLSKISSKYFQSIPSTSSSLAVEKFDLFFIINQIFSNFLPTVFYVHRISIDQFPLFDYEYLSNLIDLYDCPVHSSFSKVSDSIKNFYSKCNISCCSVFFIEIINYIELFLSIIKSLTLFSFTDDVVTRVNTLIETYQFSHSNFQNLIDLFNLEISLNVKGIMKENRRLLFSGIFVKPGTSDPIDLCVFDDAILVVATCLVRRINWVSLNDVTACNVVNCKISTHLTRVELVCKDFEVILESANNSLCQSLNDLIRFNLKLENSNDKKKRKR